MKLVYGIIAFFILGACNSSAERKVGPTVYFCGAENKVENEEGRQVFESDNAEFRSAEMQSADYAFEGDYSVKLDSAHKYGMSFILTDITKNEFFQASVWQKESKVDGALICAVTGQADFTLNSRENGIYERRDGWMRHVVQFKAVTDLDSMTIYLFAGNEGEVSYFDNLEVKRFTERPNQELPNVGYLGVFMSDSSEGRMNNYIQKALKDEIIKDKYKEYVESFLIVDGDSIPVELRLKGDWTDHLISGNVSYRIKTKSGYAFNGLRSFSIQHPKTRNYMHEWFMHELCESEDLLSTHYSFLQVDINDKNQGIYALEEHFDKQLLESRNRREGPILKVDETGFWALAVYAREQGLDKIASPYYESAIVSCFKEKRTLKSATLSAQFNNGAALLNAFKNGFDRPELLFDLDQLATYYALMDLGNIHHSLAWHNRRFYYNPITTKLEHIGFDMIPMVKPYNAVLASAEFKKHPEQLTLEGRLNYAIFRNESFRNKYTEELIRFSSIDYLDSVFNKLDSAIVRNEELMTYEMPYYQFDRMFYYEKAELIRQELKSLDKRWDEFLSRGKDAEMANVEGKYDLGGAPFYLEEISVNGFRSELDSNHYLIQLENYHFDSVTIVGYAIKANKDSIIPFDAEISLAGFHGGGSAGEADVFLDQKPSRFFFKPHNIPGAIEKKKFIKWHKPTNEHPRLALYKNFKLNSPFYKINGNKVVFKTGDYQMNKLVYIPSGYEVEFNAGTSIDFVTGAGLILNGTTHMNGGAENEIKFYSSDQTGMGITILQADSVVVRNVLMESMGTLDYLGWTLTGAFSIYESGVDIDGLTVRGNLCEDGLNIIRSNFMITNCLIEDTKSDGFDADFCTGAFLNSTFKNTGNDCIDFSGSTVSIADIVIINSGHKGVSAGERSTLYLTNIQINGAITGLASKDDSRIEGDDIVVRNAEVGIALFQKKPEYAGSAMMLYGVKYENLNQIGLIEKGSEANVNDVVYSGCQKFDIDQMYARFDKK